MFNTDGHKFPYDQIQDEITSLFIFFSANIEEMDPESSLLGSYLMVFPDVEMSSRIISLAVKLRIMDDRITRLKSDQEQDEKPNLNGICGTLDGSKQLNLRESCNKIIHAKDIRLDKERKSLLVHGMLNTDKWNAEINLNQFLSGAFDYVENVSGFDASYYRL